MLEIQKSMKGVNAISKETNDSLSKIAKVRNIIGSMLCNWRLKYKVCMIIMIAKSAFEQENKLIKTYEDLKIAIYTDNYESRGNAVC